MADRRAAHERRPARDGAQASYGDLTTLSPTMISEKPLIGLNIYCQRGGTQCLLLKSNAFVETIVGEIVVISYAHNYTGCRNLNTNNVYCYCYYYP